MFSVGLDVDKLVFTELHQFTYDEWEKILLYAGKSSISSPLVFITLGKIYWNNLLSGQSAGNFSISTNSTAMTKNTYNYYNKLPKISLFHKYFIINKHINKLRFYSTVTNNFTQINPYFITGFIDGEGSFVIRVRKNNKSKIGWYVEPIFAIGLHQRDKEVLNIIQNYFGRVGRITIRKDVAIYWVSSLQDLNNKIIPHFLKYYLLSQKKKADFILFKNIIDLMIRKEHLTLDGLLKIVSIKASINRGLTNDLKRDFPNIYKIERPLIQDQKISDSYWLSGFASGEASFRINIFNSSNKSGKTVRLLFSITQHSRDG